MKFGKLTIQDRHSVKHKDGSWLWNAKCDCGTSILRSASNIIRSAKKNATQSCGCIRNKDLDMTKKYGFLTPIKRLEKVDDLGFEWEFKCDCGKIVKKIGSHVQRGQGALHCGCSRRKFGVKDLEGKKFGNLTVISFAGNNKNGQSTWNTRCDCGKLLTITGYYLRRKKDLSCGCQRSHGENHSSFSGYGGIYKSYFSGLKLGAELRELSFEITIENLADLFIKQNGICALSGVEITLKSKHIEQTASVDRKDSSKGYTLDNIQWVHKTINKMKNNLNEIEFIELCRKITEYRS